MGDPRMGFSADFALLRTDEPLESFDELVAAMWRPQFARYTRCGEGWLLTVIAGFGLDPYEVESRLLKSIVARSGAPALLGSVFDCDELHVAGFDGTEYWEAWLDPETGPKRRLMASLHRAARAQGDRTSRFDYGWSEPYPADWQDRLERSGAEMRLARPAIAQAAARWAAAAGRQVPAEPIEHLLGRHRNPCAEDLFTDLAGLLGIEGAAFTPDWL
jgi:hypothetical protein